MVLPGLFVVGTDTGVGKTHVASAIAQALSAQGRRVGVLKPVATGATRVGDSFRCDDAERLIAAIGGVVTTERVAPLIFEEPLAPTVAARRAGSPLEFETIRRAVDGALDWWAGRAEVMIVEGIGGLLTPLAEGATVADLAIRLDYPLVVVARRGLGTLNHTLLTVEAARLRGLRLAGIVLNSPEPTADGLAEQTNADEIARLLTGVGILGEFGFQGNSATTAIVDGPPDWYDRACRPRGSGRLDRDDRGGFREGEEGR